MKTLTKLEEKLFAAKPALIRDIKRTDLYSSYDFAGVYAVFSGGKLVKIGKAGGENAKENQLAGRIWGLTLADSILREEMGWTLEQTEECLVRCVRVDDALERGRLEYYLIAKHCPPVNERELKR